MKNNSIGYPAWLITLFVLVVLAVPLFLQPSITGFASASQLSKDVNLTLGEDKNYYLSFEELKTNPKITAIMISGKVRGDGEANVFIEHNNKKYLIYSNIQKPSFNAITGTVTGATVNSVENENNPETNIKSTQISFTAEDGSEGGLDDNLRALIESYEGNPLVNFEKEFKNVCVQTCFLENFNTNRYKFIFELDRGVVLDLTSILLHLELEDDANEPSA